MNFYFVFLKQKLLNNYIVINFISQICINNMSFNLQNYLRFVFSTYCTMLGVLDLFWPPIVHVSPPKTPFGLVILLLQSSITRNYNHTQLFITRLRVYTIIITYTLVTKVTYNTLTRLHWLTSQLSLLSQIITHFPCLSPIETSLVELLPNTDP
jgi:hypothetical protein